MRTTRTATILALTLVGLLIVPAAAAVEDTRTVIPVEEFITQWNPCTEEPTQVHLIAELDIHALPSIAAFFTGEDEHATLKWRGEAIGDDGYAMPWRNYATAVINGGVDDGVFVVSEVDNLLFSGADGGKYRLTLRFHVTEVGGVVEVISAADDAVCVVEPRG